MSKSSGAASDPLVKDAEKGAAGLKMAAAEEEAGFIKRALDVFFVVYLLFCVGIVAAMVMVSDNWWDPWPAVVIISPICALTLWLTPMMKDVYVGLYATKEASGTASRLIREDNQSRPTITRETIVVGSEAFISSYCLLL